MKLLRHSMNSIHYFLLTFFAFLGVFFVFFQFLHGPFIVFIIFLLAQKISLVQFGFVKSGLFSWEKAWGVFVFEPDLVTLVVDHVCCLGRVTNLISGEPM